MLALLSVSDKRGLVPFAQGLVRLGFQLLSTGGTLEALKAAGVPATQGLRAHPEPRDPRRPGEDAPPAHPRRHPRPARRWPSDRAEMEAHGIGPISLVAVNLYPFRETVAKGAGEAEVIEQIDIGGPAMVRAGGEELRHVAVVVDPADYDAGARRSCEADEAVGEATRRRLMRKAFAHTAAYDAAIAGWLSEQARRAVPGRAVAWRSSKVQELRYGENPHQRRRLLPRARARPPEPIGGVLARCCRARSSRTTTCSTSTPRWRWCSSSPSGPARSIIKHNTPCGVALRRRAGEGLPHGARGRRGVRLRRHRRAQPRGGRGRPPRRWPRPSSRRSSRPSYSRGRAQVLAAKKNLRLLEAGPALARRGAAARRSWSSRSVSGGLLVQDRDAVEPAAEWKVVDQARAHRRRS